MERLLVLTTPPQSQSVVRNFTNKPEIRHQKVYNSLRLADATIFFVDQILTINAIIGLNVHDQHMLRCLAETYDSFCEEPDDGFLEYFQDGIVPYTIPHFKPKLEKISALKFWQQLGAYANDTFTPIFEDTWKHALESANNCYQVKNYIRVKTPQTIYCLNLYPGHHAGKSNYGGYCFLNNAAICAKSLLDSSIASKVAILDLDYHAGDGTADIFKEDPRVTTVSIHANTNYDYPFYSCQDEDSDDIFYNKFISFKPHCTPEQYHKHVGSAIDYICKDMPNVLIIAFGGDTYLNDPDASVNCRCGLDIINYYNIGKQIRAEFRDIPIVVTQEGGYDMDHIGEICKAFLEGLL